MTSLGDKSYQPVQEQVSTQMEKGKKKQGVVVSFILCVTHWGSMKSKNDQQGNFA